MKYIAFLIYIVIWDFGILAGTAYFVFMKEASGWWFLLAIVLTTLSFKPRHFDIKELPKLERKEG
jgi:hypothetical protein